MPTNRWFYYPAHGELGGYVIDGDPEDLPGFQGWGPTKTRTGTIKKHNLWGKFVYKEPLILFDGKLHYGRFLTATKVDCNSADYHSELCHKQRCHAYRDFAVGQIERHNQIIIKVFLRSCSFLHKGIVCQ